MEKDISESLDGLESLACGLEKAAASIRAMGVSARAVIDANENGSEEVARQATDDFNESVIGTIGVIEMVSSTASSLLVINRLVNNRLGSS